MSPKQIKLTILRAQRATEKARRAVVEADAAVATYWIQPKMLPSPFWLSGNLRQSAELTSSLAHTLYLTACTHLAPEKKK